MATKLSAKNLPALKEAGISLPNYDRSKLKEGIVHFGVGGFHRSHLAVYIDTLAAQQGGDWSICGVGLMPADAAMRDVMMAQDCLYTVVERSAEGSKPHVVGSITSYLYAPGNAEAVIAKLADATTRIVSLTITESGYFFSEATGELDQTNPGIAADLQAGINNSAPQTVYGYIVTALARRKKAGLPPFTVMSCDNIVQNGHLVRKMVLTFASTVDKELGAWLEAKGAFPNSMVDRITPRTTPEDSQALAQDFGIEDAWPVVTEPFIQWVIEDQFSAGRPNWEKVGVQMVDDVEPFEKMKLRLLNASHSAMGYLGYLAGFKYIHEVILDPSFRKYIRAMMDKEVRPLLPSIPGINLDAYCDTLIERFSNPTIGDHVTRICLDGSGKMPKFILPSVRDQIARGGEMKRLVLCVAAWFRYLNGEDEQGKAFTIEDPMAAELTALARKGGTNPADLLSVGRLFSDDVRNSPAFLQEVSATLASLYKVGAKATLAKFIAE